MKFKIKINTELKIDMIRGIRMLAEDNNINELKGLREAKNAFEQGIIVSSDNLNMMLQGLDVYFKRSLGMDRREADEHISFTVETFVSKPAPYVMPFRRDFVVNC